MDPMNPHGRRWIWEDGPENEQEEVMQEEEEEEEEWEYPQDDEEWWHVEGKEDIYNLYYMARDVSPRFLARLFAPPDYRSILTSSRTPCLICGVSIRNDADGDDRRGHIQVEHENHPRVMREWKRHHQEDLQRRGYKGEQWNDVVEEVGMKEEEKE